MKKYLLKIFLLSIAGLLIAPQISFAAWWNPFTWKIFSRKPTETKMEKIIPTSVPQNLTEQAPKDQSSEIEKLKKEIEELKKKPSPVNVMPKKPTPTVTEKVIPLQSTPAIVTPPPIETWGQLETKYFAEANQKGWTTLIITNALSEKQFYRKEGSQWVRKDSETEMQKPYVTPPTVSQLTRLIRMCSSAPEAQAICDKPEFMPGYYSNLAFRTAIDGLVLRYEAIIFSQQNNNVASTYVLPPIQLPSYVYSSPPPIYMPPPTFYTPPTTYSPPSRIEFSRDPRTGRIYSSSNGTNYFYDLNGRLDHAAGPNGTAQINYDLNGDLDSISY